MPRGRRFVLLAAAIAAVLLFGYVLWPSFRPGAVTVTTGPARSGPAAPGQDSTPAPSENALSPLPSPGSSSASTTPTAAGTPEATPSEDDALLQQPQVVALANRTADEYRLLAQYPPWSHPFGDEGEDPILRDRQVSPITAAGPSGEEPILTVFPDQVSFEAPDAVLLYAYLTVAGSRVAAAEISGVITSENLEPMAQIVYRDDGADGDRAGGDLVYSARFEPGPDFAPNLSDAFLVRVRALTTDAQERIAATGFLYSSPHAQLTGRYQDIIADGSLAIDAEVEVFRAGRFHLEATLYSRDASRGIAEAHTAGELAPGRHWIRLTFFGRILNQIGIDGPYLLRFVALSTTTRMPNAKNRLVENAHVTGAYRAAQFSAAPFDDPDLLDAADRLEGSLGGGP